MPEHALIPVNNLQQKILAPRTRDPVWSKNPNACFLQRLQTCHRLLNVLISSSLSPILTRHRVPKN
jgi:hypothetical protein